MKRLGVFVPHLGRGILVNGRFIPSISSGGARYIVDDILSYIWVVGGTVQLNTNAIKVEGKWYIIHHTGSTADQNKCGHYQL